MYIDITNQNNYIQLFCYLTYNITASFKFYYDTYAILSITMEENTIHLKYLRENNRLILQHISGSIHRIHNLQEIDFPDDYSYWIKYLFSYVNSLLWLFH